MNPHWREFGRTQEAGKQLGDRRSTPSVRETLSADARQNRQKSDSLLQCTGSRSNWANRVSKQEEYRGFAAACLDLASRATELPNKASLLAMAEAWLNLAERISRSPADAPLVR